MLGTAMSGPERKRNRRLYTIPGPQAASTGDGVRCTSQCGTATGVTRLSSRVVVAEEGNGVTEGCGMAVLVGSGEGVDAPLPVHARAARSTTAGRAIVVTKRGRTVSYPSCLSSCRGLFDQVRARDCNSRREPMPSLGRNTAARIVGGRKSMACITRA